MPAASMPNAAMPGPQGCDAALEPSPCSHQKSAGRHSGKTCQFHSGHIPVGIPINTADEQLREEARRYAQEDEKSVEKKQHSDQRFGQGIADAGFQICKGGSIPPRGLAPGNRYAAQEADAERGCQNVHPESGAKRPGGKQYAGGSGGCELDDRLHGGIDAVKAHEVLPRHQLWEQPR